MHRACKRANVNFSPNLTDLKCLNGSKPNKKKRRAFPWSMFEELWYFSAYYLVRGRGELKEKYSERVWLDSLLLEFMKVSTGKRLAERLWLLDKEVALRTNCTKPTLGGSSVFSLWTKRGP